jgi:hypothetical protein
VADGRQEGAVKSPVRGRVDVDEWRSRIGSDRGADIAFKIAITVSLVVFYVVGRRQWFIRDDFAFLITRNLIRTQHGIDAWLFAAQDGHWMTPPILVYRVVQNLFGIDSYWPFLIPAMAIHVLTVLLVRAVCRRCGVSPWTTTLTCALLLVFGSGWENIVFGIQITYNLSLCSFLAVVLLVDHDGRPDRHDALAAVVGLVGVMSSGFGPFFVAGAAVLMVLRRRPWLAIAAVVGPQAVAFAAWYLQWYEDPVADTVTGPRSQVPAYAVRSVVATFEGLAGIATLSGVAIAAALAVTLWRGTLTAARRTLTTLWVTALVMFLGVGFSRIGFGLDSAGVSRYRYMGAMLLAPALAAAIDAIARWSPNGRATARVVLGTSVVLNAGQLHTLGAEWAIRAREAQDVYELVSGSGLAPQADQALDPVEFNPDVSVHWLRWLVDEGAVTPRAPANDVELEQVRSVLRLPPAVAP